MQHALERNDKGSMNNLGSFGFIPNRKAELPTCSAPEVAQLRADYDLASKSGGGDTKDSLVRCALPCRALANCANRLRRDVTAPLAVLSPISPINDSSRRRLSVMRCALA